MTTTNKKEVWRCPAGTAHQLLYLGEVKQQYRCTVCLLVISKGELQEASENA